MSVGINHIEGVQQDITFYLVKLKNSIYFSIQGVRSMLFLLTVAFIWDDPAFRLFIYSLYNHCSHLRMVISKNGFKHLNIWFVFGAKGFFYM